MAITISGTGITSSQIEADGIDGTKIADDAINSEHLAAGGVDNEHLATGIDAAKLTGTLPASVLDTAVIENNIAMLGFYRATDHSKTKYSLIDQVIDDFNDATGIDAGASTNELLDTGSYSASVLASGNYFGDGSDGALSTSGNVSHTVQNKSGSYDGDMLVKQYSSLTINSGHLMTTDQPCRGMLIYVTGNCTINGTLSMTARGPSANPTTSGASDSNAVNSNGLQLAFVKSGSYYTH